MTKKTEYRLAIRLRWEYRISLLVYSLGSLYALYALLSGMDIWPPLNPLTLTQRVCLVPVMLVACITSGAFSLHRDFLERLIVLPNGVQYKAFGYMVYADWSDLKRIGNSRITINKIEGIFISYPSQNIKTWFPGNIYWFPSTASRKEIFIPLSAFDNNWRTSELGQQIKQYAPQLFSSVEN